MKISAFRQVYARTGFVVMESCRVDVPLHTVVEEGIYSNDVLTMPGISWTLERPEKGDDDAPMPAPITFREDGGTRSLEKGLIFYESLNELIGFLADRIDPDGEGPLSQLLDTARRDDGSIDRALLETFLESGPRRLRRNFIANIKTDFPLIRLRWDESTDLVPIRSGGQRYLALSLKSRRKKGVLFAMEVSKKKGGHRVPRFVIAWLTMGRMSDFLADQTRLLLFDGEKHVWKRGIHDLPAALIAELDEMGGIYHNCHFDFLPCNHLEPVAIVRVPGREEVKAMVEEMGAEKGLEAPDCAALSTPALAFDSHYPVPLAPDTEVLDTPEAAFQLLSHTVNGIYMPGQAPRMFPVKNIPEHDSYQVLARPRRLLS